MPMMGGFTDNSKELNEIINLIRTQKGESSQETINKILEIVIDLQKKLSQQSILITKIAVTLSKMYQDGEINKDTFNKLDEFLKPYYDDPYKDS